MNKLGLIIKNEYLTIVSKKSFLLITLLAPIVLPILIISPIIISRSSNKPAYHILVIDKIQKTIIQNDTISFFENKFTSNDKLVFTYCDNVDNGQKYLSEGMYDGVLEIVSTNDIPKIKAFLYYNEEPISVEAQTELQSQCKQILKNSILAVNYNFSKQEIAQVNDPQIGFYTSDLEGSEDNNNPLKSSLGVVLGLLLYIFLFFYAGQITKSICHEKSSRIVEVLLSSVKSIHLFLGKIIAVGLVGITQFILWIGLVFIIILGIKTYSPELFISPEEQQITINQRVITASEVDSFDIQASTNNIVSCLKDINVGLICSVFIIYFICGYLLYGSLFGAVGSVVDSESDSNQFVLPLSLPLLFAMACMPFLIDNPDSSLSLWLSFIPFTSPIAMLLRLPFGVPIWQVGISIAVLVLSIIVAIYCCTKIYRNGILSYGNQHSFKDMFKWISNKDK